VAMDTEISKVAADALRLPREHRAFLAERLIESLDEAEGLDLSPQWKEEVARRCRELDEGIVALIPGEKVFDEVLKALG
jgi:putative addiction module component (TIGR02574 family)